MFQHSWNPELEGGFEKVYTEPPFNTYVQSYKGEFEDNRPYEQQLRPIYAGDLANDWSQVGRAAGLLLS